MRGNAPDETRTPFARREASPARDSCGRKEGMLRSRQSRPRSTPSSWKGKHATSQSCEWTNVNLEPVAQREACRPQVVVHRPDPAHERRGSFGMRASRTRWTTALRAPPPPAVARPNMSTWTYRRPRVSSARTACGRGGPDHPRSTAGAPQEIASERIGGATLGLARSARGLEPARAPRRGLTAERMRASARPPMPAR